MVALPDIAEAGQFLEEQLEKMDKGFARCTWGRGVGDASILLVDCFWEVHQGPVPAQSCVLTMGDQACRPRREAFLELSRTSCAHSAWWGVLLLRLRPRSFALKACLSTSSAGIPSRCLQNSTGALLDRIVATPKGCTKPRTKELFGC